MYYPKITGKLCYLSPCAFEDAEYWTRWLNDLEVSLPLGDEAYATYGLERMQAEVSQSIRDREPIFTIVDIASGNPIGRCLLFAMDPVNRSVMLGIFIGEKDYWGHGYGQEATRLLLDYAFNLLNLHSVMLGVFSFNQRALHAYEKVGFRVIGRRREARLIGGCAYDVIFMDMLEDEFRALYGPGIAPQVEQEQK
jgi:RimJ/RimL family protein N-acetyltransferase